MPRQAHGGQTNKDKDKARTTKMKKFKTGDVVKVVSKECASYGNVGVVTKITDNKAWPYVVKFAIDKGEYGDNELEKVVDLKKGGKSIPCKVVCNSRYGTISHTIDFPSIAAGVRWAKESGWFSYCIFVNGKIVRRGYCND